MPPHIPPGPDIVSLRDALRGVRHAFRRSGETLVEFPSAGLPDPAAQIATVMLRGGGELAKGFDKIASRMAKRLLGSGIATVPTLAEIHRLPGAPEMFAASCYVALQSVFQQLSIGQVLISETAAREAYLRLSLTPNDVPDTAIAGLLARNMLELRVVHGAPDVQAIAVFAVVLWLMSDRCGTDGHATLTTALDLSLAVRNDIIGAGRDANRLGVLYAEFVNHV